MEEISLNLEQQLAVDHLKGPLRVIAGAGSGKTRVLISKINKLIESGVNPQKICAITFTNKAANEIKMRSLKENKFSNGIWISTYHSLCNFILRKDINKFLDLNYSNSFDIINEGQKNTLIKNIYLKYYGNLGNENAKYEIKQIANYISKNKNLIVQIKHENEMYNHIYNEYQKETYNNNALDYDDLLFLTYKLLTENVEVLNKWQENFHYLLVDEFQDSNNIQFEIIKLLAMKYNNLTIIGDPNQSIYGWRGANQKLILNFENYFKNVKTVILNYNYRSNNGILQLANNLITKHSITTKTLVSVQKKAHEYKPKLIAFPTYEEEIKYVAAKITKLVSLKNYDYSDFAVLFRNSYLSYEIEKQFSHLGINYIVKDGKKFFQRSEILSIIFIIKAVIKRDDISILEVIKLFPKIGAKTIEKLVSLKDKYNKNFIHILKEDLDELDLATATKLRDFFEVLSLYDNKLNIKNFYLMVEDLIHKFKIREKYKNYNEKIENINEMLFDIRKFESLNSKMDTIEIIEKYLDDISLNVLNDDDTNNNSSVSIMTIHSAKGLESKIVFIVALCDYILPSYYSLKLQSSLEEERRVFYVAITRAKEKLILTYNTGYSEQYKRPLNRSTFLNEIDNNLMIFKNKNTNYIQTNFVDNLNNNFFSKEKINNNIGDNFKINDQVEHPYFGSGIILNLISNELIEIKFEDINYGIRNVNSSILKKKL